ncbi:MAG: Rieske 2Fe-2S domain-containing protein [Chloroflexi bacterium]|nr:Rieske 2Fe-2S domain-containing protein [Chloroflexota bacterium]
MLSKEDNELITNTDPGTPMGNLFRRFWLPVLLAEELPAPDCAPVRVEIMGEKLIAFRDSNGKLGLMDLYCPHRGASLFFGRNEEAGLRCVYHGWKFDVNGVCTDMPSTPEGETYRQKIHISSYPVVEAGDIIWAYMGPKDRQPAFPDFEWARLPKSHRYVTKFQLECNYLQATEGDFDPAHARFLHSLIDGGGIRRGRNDGPGGTIGISSYGSSDSNEPFPRAVGDRRVNTDFPQTPDKVIIEDIGAATLNITVAEQPDGRFRAAANPTWWMPVFCPPGLVAPGHFPGNFRVPITNTSLMFFRVRWSLDPISEVDLEEYKHGGYTHPEMIPGTWRTKANVHNDYELDRLAQRWYSYTGIKTFPLQDIAMMENQWGALADRTKEHLMSMDAYIIHLRQRLLRAAKALAAGTEPPEAAAADTYRIHRAVAEGATKEEAIANVRAKCMTPLVDAGGHKIGEPPPPRQSLTMPTAPTLAAAAG